MTFLYLKSNQMGSGTDAALGEKLLTLSLEKLAAQEARIDLIGCVNSAVYLTTREGRALESLRVLERRGARIATCATCLDHLGLRHALLIGEVGNMEATARTMHSADRVLSPC